MNIEEILNSKSSLNEIAQRGPTPAKVLGREEDETMFKREKFFKKILKQEKFEGDDIYTPQHLRLIAKILKAFTDKDAISDLPTQIKSNFESVKEQLEKFVPKSLISKASKIVDIIDRKDDGEKLSKDEVKAVEDFADDFYHATFYEEAKSTVLNVAQRSKEERMDSFYSIFPIKYKKHESSPAHYGVVIPAQGGGSIHWMDQSFEDNGDSEYFLDPNTPKEVRRTLPLVNKKVAKTKAIQALRDKGRVSWDDSDAAKTKLAIAIKKAGAMIDVDKEGKIDKDYPKARGVADIKGYQKALKNVGFWSAVKSAIE